MTSGIRAIIISNINGEIIFFNHGAEKIFGYRENEILGKKVEELVPYQSRCLHIKNREGFYKEENLREMNYKNVVTGLRKDKSLIPIRVGLIPLKINNNVYVITIIGTGLYEETD